MTLIYEATQDLWQDDWRSLSRGRRITDQKPVLLKSARRTAHGFDYEKLLEREFRLLQQFSIPGLPRPLELFRPESADGGLCLTLEDDGGTLLEELLYSRNFDLSAFFKFAIQLTAAIGELHRRDLIHRSINPSGVLVHPATGAVTLVDLSLASHPDGEIHESIPSILFQNQLGYCSPEQTGRMNRAVDYRTDFYSLGVCFYEALTGKPPFASADPLELIHWHIAKKPASPIELDANLPRPLSDIVMKLLAKTAEDRYQSAQGLIADLEHCALEWSARAAIASFPLAKQDVPDRFLIPQKLYGRRPEVERLLQAFDRTCEGPPMLMLVSGYSGAGKTSLIHELYRPLIQRRGYFISGKFDQASRGKPFGPLTQAFRGLIRQLLTESEEQLAAWRGRIADALGKQGGALAELIPEIELIVGKQPQLPEVGPTEALNRFQLVFQNFVGALARPNQPLIVFLDDLQWADAATLGLLSPLLASPNLQSQLLIGTYRDNEVDAAHPLTKLMLDLEELEKGQSAHGRLLDRIHLGPLELPDLISFVGEALHCETEEAESLAELVQEKTGGNPFFAIQFLKTLHQGGLLKFDDERRCWKFRIEEIANAKMTDNVVEMMSQKIQRLGSKSQHLLTLASCIGNTFDKSTLAIVSERSTETVAEHLNEAIREGLIQRPSETSGNDLQTYRFLHDRVQQAAYALIPEKRREAVHLALGRLLHDNLEGNESEEKLFDIVQHLNLGSGLIFAETERLSLARLNLRAGRKAKSSTAFEAALQYFKTGGDLLNDEHWQSEYDLAFELHLEAAESMRLCANFDEAEHAYKILLQNAGTSLDLARVHSQRILQYENQSRYADALTAARESLALFGVSFPANSQAQQTTLEQELAKIQSHIGKRTIASLTELPVMTDSATRMVMSILTISWSSAYISGEQSLTRLISAVMTRLSLEHGNSEESAYGYATHAITVGPVRSDYESAYEFGLLALNVNERFNDSRLRAKVYQQVQAHALLWRRPLQSFLAYAREARRSGFENGDFTYGMYGAFTETWPAIVVSEDLAEFVKTYGPDLELFKKLKAGAVGDGLKVMLNWAQALRLKTRSPFSLSDDEFDEKAYLETYRGNPFYTMFFVAAKLHLYYLLGEYEKALDAAKRTREMATSLTGTIWTVLSNFWGGLTLAANYEGAADEERRQFLAEMENARAFLAILADNCPENFRCQSLLLSGEIERVKGNPAVARDFLEQGLGYAETVGGVQQRALACELFARFLFENGQRERGDDLISKAYGYYLQWGAHAKVEELERKHLPLVRLWLRAPAPQHPRASADQPIGAAQRHTIQVEAGSLDLFSVMKASQAIASEIEFEKLLAGLIRIAIENAGAQRGLLLLNHESEFYLHAEGSLEGTKVTLHGAPLIDETVNLPLSIVNYVRRTSEGVLLEKAESDDRFGRDPYIQRSRPRSVICVPVLSQGRPIGALYLENNLTGGAFTPERMQICSILASQAAISLENARLYDEVKSEEARLRSIMEGTAGVTGEDFFASLARHLAQALGVRYAFVTECRERIKLKARTLAFWMGDRLGENVVYEIAETPCRNVLAGETCYYPVGLQQLFPNDKDLVDLSAVGYLGIPLCNATGEVIGHLAIIDDKPMEKTPRGLSLLTIFAARAGAELERLQAQDELKRAMAEVERLKNRLQAENIYLQEEIRREHNFEEIVGSSPALLDVLQQVERAAPTDATILILGETGTGKELIARAIADRSGRKDRPLVKVNCGAISAGLVESELFGHVKGAFTGALGQRIGRFELADGGTLFLDEVGELPPETQVKLLRVLQEGEFEPVGGNKTIKVDVRIIAATNRDLDSEIKAGRFRADLYYRLNVLPLYMPPLRARRLDIPQLAMFFLSRYSRRFGRQVEGISQETMDLMMNYAWPGNIRELQNLIERAVALTTSPVLTIDGSQLSKASPASQVIPAAQSEPTSDSTPLSVMQSDAPKQASAPASLDELQRRHILTILARSNWIIEGENGAARALNLHPNTLRSRMKKLGIQRPKS